MKFRIVYKAWWMFWAKGMVLWPWIWFNPAKMHVSNILYRHELEHCYQVKRMGRFKFYTSYLWLLAKHGYKNHPYENEANDREHDPLTDQEKQWIADGKVKL
jgi:hypothetical protein